MPRKLPRETPPTTAFGPVLDAPLPPDLVHLVRMIARQAAREAFEVYKSALSDHGVVPTCGRREKARHGPRAKAESISSSSASDEEFLSVRQAAKRLNVSEKKIRRMIQAGELRAHRFGKLFRIRQLDLIPPYAVDPPVADDE